MSQIFLESSTLSRVIQSNYFFEKCQKFRSKDIDWLDFGREWATTKGFASVFFLDVSTALAKKFVRKVDILNPEALQRHVDKPALFIGNHQNIIESMIFPFILTGFSNVPVYVISKQELKDSFFGAMIEISGKYAKKKLVQLLLFDRSSPKNLIEIIRKYGDEIDENPTSLFFHSEGTRALCCRKRVEKLGSVFINLATNKNLTIFPLRFYGGLPVSELPKRIVFPHGFTKQDYYIGNPVEPEYLMNFSLASRRKIILDAINSTGPRIEDEKPFEPNHDFARKIEHRVNKGFDTVMQAVIIESLKELSEISEESALFLDAIEKRDNSDGKINKIPDFFYDLK